MPRLGGVGEREKLRPLALVVRRGWGEGDREIERDSLLAPRRYREGVMEREGERE